ncbi:MAG: ligase-associated DNA damage response exonuclease [Pseudomonadota bacterium]
MALLEFTQAGIYCAAGDFYIDPWRPVPRAVITHGHADHARPGMGHYLCTDGCAPVMRHRLGAIDVQTARYGEVLDLNGVSLSFHPAGHVPGSAQVRVEQGGEVWVVSGDYKAVDDGLSAPFEPVRCHHFITESTFGLPVFRWAPQAQVAAQINDWWRGCRDAGQTAVLGAYALGKAQRLLSMLDPGIGPIMTHASVENTNAILRAQGFALPDTVRCTLDTPVKDHPGAILIAPPSATDAKWAARWGSRQTAFASGWMAIRGIRRRRAGDRGFVISDHADWDGLLQAITDTGAENIYVTHGYTDIFTRYLNENGWNARVVPTEFGGEEDDAPEAA